MTYEELKKAHRCTYCGAQLPDGHKGLKCKACQDRVNRKQSEKYQERKDAGLCIQCGMRKAVIGRVKCRICQDQERRNRNKRAFAGMVLSLAVLLAGANNIHAAEADIRADALEICEGPESAAEVRPELEDLGEFQLTFYCPCRLCNGKNVGIDCFGSKLVWGTVAVDPKVIKLKTHLIIDGFDMEFVARDVGDEWVQGKHIDIFVPKSHEEAAQMNDKYSRAKVWRLTE